MVVVRVSFLNSNIVREALPKSMIQNNTPTTILGLLRITGDTTFLSFNFQNRPPIIAHFILLFCYSKLLWEGQRWKVNSFVPFTLQNGQIKNLGQQKPTKWYLLGRREYYSSLETEFMHIRALFLNRNGPIKFFSSRKQDEVLYNVDTQKYHSYSYSRRTRTALQM